MESNTLFLIREGGMCGYMNKEGKTVIQPQFRYAEDFSEGLAKVANWNKENIDKAVYIFIDMEGKTGIDNLTAGTYPHKFYEGLAAVHPEDGNCYYIDKTGKVIIKTTFWSCGNFSEGLASFTLSEPRKSGYIDKSGKIVIPAKWDEAGLFREGLAPVQISVSKWGYIDRNGNTAIDFTYYTAQIFSEGLAWVKYPKNKQGYIDKKNVMKIKTKTGVFEDDKLMNSLSKAQNRNYLEYALPFSEGLAAVNMGNLRKDSWGYINKTGKLVIKPQYISADPFRGGLARVKLPDTREAYISKSGTIIWQEKP